MFRFHLSYKAFIGNKNKDTIKLQGEAIVSDGCVHGKPFVFANYPACTLQP